jgi:hypothetical protein
MVRPRRFRPESPDELERRSVSASTPSAPAPRAELLHVVMLSDAPDLRATNVL